MTERKKRTSRALEALEAQIAEQEARAEEDPLEGFAEEFNLDLLKGSDAADRTAEG